jgi:Tetracyclin repressor-like, C-terminal domain
LDAPQRKAIATWAEKLQETLVRFLKEGMADGSVIQCEPEFVTQLLLGMLIWLAKWAPNIDGMTVDRLRTPSMLSVFRAWIAARRRYAASRRLLPQHEVGIDNPEASHAQGLPKQILRLCGRARVRRAFPSEPSFSTASSGNTTTEQWTSRPRGATPAGKQVSPISQE